VKWSSLLGTTSGFTVDASRVFVVVSPTVEDAGVTVMAGPTDGGTPVAVTTAPRLLSSRNLPVGTVLVDEASVYWVIPGGGEVLRAPITGGASTTLASDAYPRAPSCFALDESAVYWADGFRSAILSVPKAGGQTATILSGVQGVNGVAVDTANVYFTGDAEGIVARVPKGGGSVVTLARGEQPWGVAVDDTSVYWADADLGVIRSAPK